jgi:hypothetical protein
MRRWILAAALLGLLAAGEAGATVDKKKSLKPTGATSGGEAVAPADKRLRVQCWQAGRKIIDESELAITSMGIANQVNGVRLRRLGGPDGAVTLLTQSRTTCLLAPHD